MNNVIRELVHALFFLYDANEVIGIIGGFSGFAGGNDREPLKLTLETVADCHHQGGSILASSRGGFDIDTIIGFLQREQISQLYVIGGDGSHRGAYKIAEEVVKREMNVAVVGIPKVFVVYNLTSPSSANTYFYATDHNHSPTITLSHNHASSRTDDRQ